MFGEQLVFLRLLYFLLNPNEELHLSVSISNTSEWNDIQNLDDMQMHANISISTSSDFRRRIEDHDKLFVLIST